MKITGRLSKIRNGGKGKGQGQNKICTSKSVQTHFSHSLKYIIIKILKSLSEFIK